MASTTTTSRGALSERDANQDDAMGDVRNSAQKAALSKKFQKKTQLEHILLRPDTYIGSVERVTQPMWVLQTAPTRRIVERPVTFVPGLYKIVDEILVNAADNKRRDPTMSSLKVDINRETGEIAVRNDGKGIPVEKHVEHGIYIPELIFGHLLTGENFDDEEERVVGGRNGYGAKLANIFSKRFTIETQDQGRLYRQTWERNMSTCHAPEISKGKEKADFTRVSFVPDYARFGMPDGLDDDAVALLSKRVYDMAGVTDKSVKVTLNGESLSFCNTFDKYTDLYFDAAGAAPAAAATTTTDEETLAATTLTGASPPAPPKLYARINDRWEVCVTTSRDGSPQQVSFVNSICTYKGGQHVAYVTDQITKAVLAHIQKKNKAQANVVKPAQIKNHLWVFVNCLIVNPAFDSQTKENLTTRPPKFGPKEFMPELSEQLLTKIVKSSGVVENVLYWAQAKQAKDLKKVGGAKKSKLLDIPKLDDANLAGGKHSQDCTLILTEGDSAKTLALSGISVVGRDKFGVFPLKGKLLNVRDAGHAQIMKNQEIQHLMKIIGLRPGEAYEDTSKLRYGHVMVMTDQDQDGSHIKGLIFNFFHHFFPSLLAIKGFLRVFVTPIVKVSKGVETKSFYSLHEYQAWKTKVQVEAGDKAVAAAAASTSGGGGKKATTATATANIPEADLLAMREHAGEAALKAWRVKYYKGLGTSSSKEAQEYFAAIKEHVIDMVWSGALSGDAIDMAFSKSRVEDRKRWLSAYDAVSGPRVDFRVKQLEFRDFVQGELVHFSLSDNVRSIPSLFDGLKPSQRKVLFACFKRKLVHEIKVSQLAGYISENAAYHHGEESLASTIVGMAQTFVGSNNVALLHAGGAFGTRRMGGKDAASSRYIHTRLEPVTRALFPLEDDPLYEPLEDDGQLIEPKFYVPVIPLLLVNGASGIGTGWSTEVPPMDPRDVVRAVRKRVTGLELTEAMQPWFRGFTGDIEPEFNKKRTAPTGRFTVRGECSLDGNTLIISELPVGKWTASYKEFLLEIVNESQANARGEKDKEAGSAAAAKEEKVAFGRRAFPDGAIREIREHHTDETVLFELELSDSFAESLAKMPYEEMLAQFQLTTTISTSNMHAFDEAGVIRKYETPESMLEAFLPMRRDMYVKRKAHLEKVLTVEVDKLTAQARFVRMVVDGELVLAKRKKDDVLAKLVELGFPLHFKGDVKGSGKGASSSSGDNAAAGAEEDDDADGGGASGSGGKPGGANLAKGYDYLLSMSLWSLTAEKVRALEEKAADKASELAMLRRRTPEEFWLADLDVLEKALDDIDEELRVLREQQDKARSKAGNKRPVVVRRPKVERVAVPLVGGVPMPVAAPLPLVLDVGAAAKPAVKKPAAAAAAAVRKPAKAKKRKDWDDDEEEDDISFTDSDEEDDDDMELLDDEEEVEVVKPKAVAVAAPAKKPAAATAAAPPPPPKPKPVVVEDDDEEDEFVFGKAAPAPPKPATAAPKRKAAPKKFVEEEEDDPVEDDDDEDDDFSPPPKAKSQPKLKAKPAATAAAAKPAKTVKPPAKKLDDSLDGLDELAAKLVVTPVKAAPPPPPPLRVVAPAAAVVPKRPKEPTPKAEKHEPKRSRAAAAKPAKYVYSDDEEDEDDDFDEDEDDESEFDEDDE